MITMFHKNQRGRGFWHFYRYPLVDAGSVSHISAPSTAPSNYYVAFDALDSDPDDANGFDGHLDDVNPAGNIDASPAPHSHTNARCVQSTYPTHLPLHHSLFKITIRVCSSNSKLVSFMDLHNTECCTVSSMANHMLHDYSSFLSYNPCHNCIVILGVKLKLEIKGYGSTKFAFNDKVILVHYTRVMSVFTPFRNIDFRKAVNIFQITIKGPLFYSMILKSRWMIL